MNKHIVVAIDGHSSCGKSTFAKQVAADYNLLYVDSGAMYRATTLFALKKNLIRDGELLAEGIEKIIKEVNIDVKRDSQTGDNITVLNGEVVENEIRGMEVSHHVSNVSKIPAIREKMVALQRRLGEQKSIVMDGRDIGSVVFPTADIKIFLTASPEIRAKRRYQELQKKGINTDYQQVFDNIKTRDYIDENREHSPLIKADNAQVLDNSNMTVKEQMEWFSEKFENILQ